VNDPYVPCPYCDGESGTYGFTGGYRVTGSGYGDAVPTEGEQPCPRCEGEGEVYVDSVTDEEWKEVG